MEKLYKDLTKDDKEWRVCLICHPEGFPISLIRSMKTSEANRLQKIILLGIELTRKDQRNQRQQLINQSSASTAREIFAELDEIFQIDDEPEDAFIYDCSPTDYKNLKKKYLGSEAQAPLGAKATESPPEQGNSDGVASPKGDAENPDLKGAGLQGV